mmetsp:Transcript_110130/g.350925  ORF Transcript_110130/g.350925 Transcript_110130/m.350925 type:complete len:296 (+) Transcript_110130:789-1676(+)
MFLDSRRTRVPDFTPSIEPGSGKVNFGGPDADRASPAPSPTWPFSSPLVLVSAFGAALERGSSFLTIFAVIMPATILKPPTSVELDGSASKLACSAMIAFSLRARIASLAGIASPLRPRPSAILSKVTSSTSMKVAPSSSQASPSSAKVAKLAALAKLVRQPALPKPTKLFPLALERGSSFWTIFAVSMAASIWKPPTSMDVDGSASKLACSARTASSLSASIALLAASASFFRLRPITAKSKVTTRTVLGTSSSASSVDGLSTRLSPGSLPRPIWIARSRGRVGVSTRPITSRA